MIIPRHVPTVESVGRHYDDLDVYYREIWGSTSITGCGGPDANHPKTPAGFIRLRRMKPQVGEKVVCDVGCGYGGTARFLANIYKAQVTGVTVSEAQFRYASEKANGHGNPRYLLQNWLTNPFEDSSFDALVSIECLAHVPDKPKYFQEIARVLKPGRRAAIYAWLADDRPKRWEERHLLEPICSEGRLPSMGSAEEYKQMIADAGLQLVRYEELSRNVRKTWWICARRLMGRLCTTPHYRQALFDRTNGNRVFAITLFRILAAYHTGAMQYGLFVMQKPASEANGTSTP